MDKIGNFCGDGSGTNGDVPLAGTNDMTYRKCQDTIGDTEYLDTALKHANDMGLQGAITIGFLFDTELNFGDDDDPNGVAGAKTVIAKATADYGPGMPTSFVGKPWEESRWLGFLIKERTWVMATDPGMTWQQDMDQNATWEAARRLHTGKTNNPESATDLSMAYDFVSAYKAGYGSAPCWPTCRTRPTRAPRFTTLLRSRPIPPIRARGWASIPETPRATTARARRIRRRPDDVALRSCGPRSFSASLRPPSVDARSACRRASPP